LIISKITFGTMAILPLPVDPSIAIGSRRKYETTIVLDNSHLTVKCDFPTTTYGIFGVVMPPKIFSAKDRHIFSESKSNGHK